jgi:hypothetical protein
MNDVDSANIGTALASTFECKPRLTSQQELPNMSAYVVRRLSPSGGVLQGVLQRLLTKALMLPATVVGHSAWRWAEFFSAQSISSHVTVRGMIFDKNILE